MAPLINKSRQDKRRKKAQRSTLNAGGHLESDTFEKSPINNNLCKYEIRSFYAAWYVK